METENNIGEIFREAFKDFERKPSDNLWNNIETRAKTPAIKNKLMRNRTNLFIGSASFVIIAIIGYFLFLNTTNPINKNNTATITKDNLTSQNTPNNNTNNSNKINTPSNTYNNNNTPYTIKETSIAKDTVVNVNNQKQNTNLNLNNKADNNLEKSVSTVSNSNSTTNIISQKSNTNNSSTTATTQKTQTTKNTTNVSVPNNTGENISISFTPDQTICKGDKVKLEVSGGVSYLWSTGDRSQYIIVNPNVSTDYSIIATDSKGSRKSSLINVTVNDCEALYVPNAFAPNGEGKAAIFKAYGSNVRSFEIVVYSRTGQLVFSSKNIDEGWNGAFNGNILPMGVYVYRISYIDQLNNSHTLNGHVSLIR